MESRKMVGMNLTAGQQWRHRHREQTCGHSKGRRGWDRLREQRGNTCITVCKIREPFNLLYDSGSSNPVLCDNPEAVGWGGRWKGRSEGRGPNIYLWLIHVDVWQKSTKY